jgi:hypothetical protein
MLFNKISYISSPKFHTENSTSREGNRSPEVAMLCFEKTEKAEWRMFKWGDVQFALEVESS